MLILSGAPGSLLQASGFPWSAPEALRFETGSEGIHEEADGKRFLRISLPPPLSEGERKAVLESLPAGGLRLLDPESDFSILAIGDSVTATGPYPEILARLLEQKTGRTAGTISVRRSAYPGKSVDAAIRNWRKDSEPYPADLVLIMFGLNDQAAGSSLEAYIRQMEWLVRHARERGADVMLMEPTPHIDIVSPAEASIFRTIAFAGALREVSGRALVVPSFTAIWRSTPDNGKLREGARAMWPYFPEHYQKPFSSLVESSGKGDTIHPNAAGHLLLARAVLETILQNALPESSLQLSASSRWQENRLISSLVATNHGGQRRHGEIYVYPYPSDDRHQAFPYDLGSGETRTFEFVWPDINKPEDVPKWPTSRVFYQGIPWLQIADIHRSSLSSSQWSIRALPAEILPARRWDIVAAQNVVPGESPFVSILQSAHDGEREVQATLEKNRQTQRIPLFEVGKGSVRELVAVRAAPAISGEAVLDGALDEWPPEEASWITLMTADQAPGTWENEWEPPPDFQVRWAFKVGEKGIWSAFATSATSGDRVKGDEFTLLFDAESVDVEKIGQAAPYTWVSGKIGEEGKLTLQAGDSSRQKGREALAGRWQYATDEGAVTGELFIPYHVMNITRWPEKGDVGFSLVWIHKVAPEKRLHLHWSADRFPWNTLGFGILRRDPVGELPWKIRLR